MLNQHQNKVRYEKHNIPKNLITAVRVGDRETARKMAAFEIGDLIKTNKPLVVCALKDAGVEVSKKPSPRELASKLVDNLGQNKKLASNIAFLMVKKRELPMLKQRAVKMSNASGEPSKIESFFQGLFKTGGQAAQGASAGGAGGVVAGIVGGVSGAISSIFDYKAKKEQAAAEKEKTKAEILKSIFGGDGGNTGLWIGLVVGVLALGIVTVVLIRR